MTFINSLRGRITAAFFLGAVGLSALLFITVDFFADDMEYAYLNAHLRDNMQLLLEQERAGGEFRLPYSATLRGYSFIRGQQAEPLPVLKDISPGYQEVLVDGRELHVLVVDEGDRRHVLTYDGATLERVEEALLAWLLFGLLVASGVITAYGYWMSVRIAKPITELADSIEALQGEAAVVPLNGGQSRNDEVARLCRAFNEHSLRLADFINRERTFTADVSHELRNPVMAATTAVELLEARGDLDPKAIGQIARVRRAVDRMQGLIELFLGLSREPPSTPGCVVDAATEVFDVVAVAERVVERYADTAQAKGLRLNLMVRAHPEARGDSSMAAVVLDNVVANAVQYTLAGSVDVIVDGDGVEIADSGPGIAESERRTVLERLERGVVGLSSSTVGFGLGLSIVSRICEHQGWRFELRPVADAGTRASLAFDKREAAKAVTATAR